MRDYFVDDRLLITPLRHEEGVQLCGDVVGTHQVPLVTAVAQCAQRADEITVDLTRVAYLSNSGLAALVGFARTLRPPQYLYVTAGHELRLQQRLEERGWDQLDTLRLHAG
ncbi:hypothetical protein OKJ48_44025 [Streptomyces kunmingensis]|uniref:STAS domain-containing protein n=1 Tax=Streptomyces kunmingensis TaxID=68225 RepID=A0ABU6CSY9_9ACTN|nr:hypothetical protein [Streptomyces kunmingensis]MEB3967157.1 hypothetical protein [Streptomyces kunmingensis]